MHRLFVYTASAGIVFVLTALASGVINSGHSSGTVRDASSAVAAPEAEPTYISELAPPVTRPPRQSGLPNTGQQDTTAFPLVPVAGISLAILGVLLIHAGLSSTGKARWHERATP